MTSLLKSFFTDSHSNSEENLFSSVSITAWLISNTSGTTGKRDKNKEQESVCVFTSLHPDRRQWKRNKQVVHIPISSLYELHQPSIQHRVSLVASDKANFKFSSIIFSLCYFIVFLTLKRFDLESWGSDENDNIPGRCYSVTFLSATIAVCSSNTMRLWCMLKSFKLTSKQLSVMPRSHFVFHTCEHNLWDSGVFRWAEWNISLGFL